MKTKDNTQQVNAEVVSPRGFDSGGSDYNSLFACCLT